MVWVPRYIKQTIAKRPGQIVSSEDWNDLFNLLIGQGDYTAEGLLTTITTFTNNLTAKADLVSGKIPLEQIPEIFKPTGLEALITTVGSLGTTVDGLVPTVNNLVAAVDGIEDYVLPTASTTVKGGIKIDGTSIIADVNGVVHTPGILTETIAESPALYTTPVTLAKALSNFRYIILCSYYNTTIYTQFVDVNKLVQLNYPRVSVYQMGVTLTFTNTTVRCDSTTDAKIIGVY